MKKLLLAALATTALASPFEAKSRAHGFNGQINLGYPFFKNGTYTKIEDDGTVKDATSQSLTNFGSFGISGDIQYLYEVTPGFLLGGGLTIGYDMTSDIVGFKDDDEKVGEEKTARALEFKRKGFKVAPKLNIGYNTRNMVFGAEIAVGYAPLSEDAEARLKTHPKGKEQSVTKFSDVKLKNKENDELSFTDSLYLEGTPYFMYYVTNNVAVSLKLGLRYNFWEAYTDKTLNSYESGEGANKTKFTDYDKKGKISGVFEFSPSLGVNFTF